VALGVRPLNLRRLTVDADERTFRALNPQHRKQHSDHPITATVAPPTCQEL